MSTVRQSSAGETSLKTNTSTATSVTATTVTSIGPSKKKAKSSLRRIPSSSSSESSSSSVAAASPERKAFFSQTTVVSDRTHSVEQRFVKNSGGRSRAVTTTKKTVSRETEVTQERAVITSLKEITLREGFKWSNPYYDEAPVAMRLTTNLQDSMNELKGSFANDMNRRKIFESVIASQTRQEAPIKVENDVDDEPCPTFEFMWTDLMLYGKGVPRPDRDLQGCNCVGPCDPTSKRCACVVRQEYYTRDLGNDCDGFAYEKDGRMLRYTHVPVFECNEACGCTEDCYNRVSSQHHAYVQR